jgi:hypothetical protein
MIKFIEKESFFSCCIVHVLGLRKKAVGVVVGVGMARRKTRC